MGMGLIIEWVAERKKRVNRKRCQKWCLFVIDRWEGKRRKSCFKFRDREREREKETERNGESYRERKRKKKSDWATVKNRGSECRLWSMTRINSIRPINEWLYLKWQVVLARRILVWVMIEAFVVARTFSRVPFGSFGWILTNRKDVDDSLRRW